MATGTEIPGNVIDGTERVEQFTKRDCYQRITIATLLKKKGTEKGNIPPQRRPRGC